MIPGGCGEWNTAPGSGFPDDDPAFNRACPNAVPSKHPLGTNDLPLPPHHSFTRPLASDGQRLERTLRPMVIVLPLQHINMQSHSRILGPASQPMMDHLCVQIPHHGPLEAKIAHEKGS